MTSKKEEPIAHVNTCNEGHEQVTFLCDKCPVCEVVKECDIAITLLHSQIDQLIEVVNSKEGK